MENNRTCGNGIEVIQLKWFENVTYHKEDAGMTNIEKVNKFLDDAKTFYFLTTDGDQPKGRPFGFHLLDGDKLYFGCGTFKNVYAQLTKNPRVEVLAVSGQEFMRYDGVVKIVKDLDQPLIGKDVLIVEDIIDSGRTLSYLIEILKQRNPNSIRLCTLLDKPERRVRDVRVDYCCFNIPDEFVVGYGLDYAQKYRNLPFIGVVELGED